MEHAREYTISVLKDLLNICREEQMLFNTAKEKINDILIKQTFQTCVNEKAENIHKLESEIKRLGGTLEYTGNDFSSAINSSSYKKLDLEGDNIVGDCITTDSLALKKYSNAMKEDILWEVVPLVAKQYFDSKDLHDKILFLCGKMQQQNSINV